MVRLCVVCDAIPGGSSPTLSAELYQVLVDLGVARADSTADRPRLCRHCSHWRAKALRVVEFVAVWIGAFVTVLQRLFPEDRALKRPELAERRNALQVGGEFQEYALTKHGAPAPFLDRATLQLYTLVQHQQPADILMSTITLRALCNDAEHMRAFWLLFEQVRGVPLGAISLRRCSDSALEELVMATKSQWHRSGIGQRACPWHASQKGPALSKAVRWLRSCYDRVRRMGAKKVLKKGKILQNLTTCGFNKSGLFRSMVARDLEALLHLEDEEGWGTGYTHVKLLTQQISKLVFCALEC
ncbi:unnamed protein product [Durusdinium trenchii]|uniref:Uncharacterized protein n=1 Tax=Durusdinium trenchii TaxID=1381693 RepID=A0ABP0IY46_9DINO